MKLFNSSGRAVIATAAIVVLAALAPAQELAGVDIGQRAPAFTLKDQNGQETSLESLLQQGPVVLVFYRSADWCLPCKLQLIQLQRHLKQIEAAGGQVAGVSFDPIPVLQRFSKGKRITFPLLSDREGRTITAYGMNTPGADKEWAGIAQHGTFVIDRQGIIRTKSTSLSYDDPREIEALVRTLMESRSAGGTQP